MPIITRVLQNQGIGCFFEHEVSGDHAKGLTCMFCLGKIKPGEEAFVCEISSCRKAVHVECMLQKKGNPCFHIREETQYYRGVIFQAGGSR